MRRPPYAFELAPVKILDPYCSLFLRFQVEAIMGRSLAGAEADEFFIRLTGAKAPAKHGSRSGLEERGGPVMTGRARYWQPPPPLEAALFFARRLLFLRKPN